MYVYTSSGKTFRWLLCFILSLFTRIKKHVEARYICNLDFSMLEIKRSPLVLLSEILRSANTRQPSRAYFYDSRARRLDVPWISIVILCSTGLMLATLIPTFHLYTYVPFFFFSSPSNCKSFRFTDNGGPLRFVFLDESSYLGFRTKF